MSDKFLEDHRLAERTYRLCGPLTPASIRDMSVRAGELVARLLAYDKIKNDSNVLIVGAGVAGVSCAAALLTLSQCRVTLNDKIKSPLSLQTAVRHRHVTPHGFDWPYYFYRRNRYPLLGSSAMPWNGGAADDVAKQFNARFGLLVGQQPRGRFHSVMANPIVHWTYDPRQGWDVRFQSLPESGAPIRQQFTHLVLCCGIGAENDTLGGYQGYRFWDFEDPFLSTGAMALDSNDHVLISGGGDGGLNDFVRLLTGESTPENLLPSLEALIGAKFKARYQAIQALAHRHFLLSLNPEIDRRINVYAFDAHQRLARRLYHTNAMKDALSRLLLVNRPSVQLIVRQQSFGRCYTPNAMLASLLARAVAREGNGDRPPLVFGSEILDVKSNPSHPFPASAADWAARSVEVTLAPTPAATADQLPEVKYLLQDQVAELGVAGQRSYRCIFVRTGPQDNLPSVLMEIQQAIQRAGADPILQEVRHAVPQSPIRR
ncbi:MAG: hypothetical protein M3O30_19460 [Planctomycetota bacterium]|nr:hypothetical protein [Planctomycetota bacterium]